MRGYSYGYAERGKSPASRFKSMCEPDEASFAAEALYTAIMKRGSVICEA